jgi:hypothetical protein
MAASSPCSSRHEQDDVDDDEDDVLFSESPSMTPRILRNLRRRKDPGEDRRARPREQDDAVVSAVSILIFTIFLKVASGSQPRMIA